MVKRATIHVSSRTKKNHPKTLRNQRNKKKTTNTTHTTFYNQVTFAEKAVAIWSWRSCSISWHSFSPWHNLSKLSYAHGLSKELFLVVYLAEGLYTRAACFVLAKRCYLL